MQRSSLCLTDSFPLLGARFVFSFVALFAALATTGATAQISNWPEFQFGNDRLGFNPYEVILGPSNVSQLGQLWQANPVSDVIYAAPAVANGVLYGITFDSGEVFALNALSGAILWRRNVQGQFFMSAPTVVDNVVYVGAGVYGSNTGALYAMDARTGDLLWSNSTVNAIQTAPTAADGPVYVASEQGVVYALDAGSGQIRWSYNTNAGSGTGSAAALANGVLYVGVGEFLFALNAADGTFLWQHQTSYFISASPAVQNGVVFISSYDGGVYALDATSGALLWHRAIRALYFSSPAVAYGKVYLCGFEGSPGLTALDAQTGNILWSRQPVQCEYASPVVANGVVYAAWQALGNQSTYMVAFDASTGALLWDQHVGSAVYGSPIVVNGTLYVTTYSGEVLAFALNHN